MNGKAKNDLMPALFVGHGSPINAVSRNAYSKGWSDIGASIPRPRAVLAISAHCYMPDSAVTISSAPRTIHDFGGFPDELYQVKYPAAGDSALARQVRDVLSPTPVRLDENWGLDHGTWSVLIHIFPKADVPVVQLSINGEQPPHFHFEMGKRLAALREEGVLVIGSGSVVHNLQTYSWGTRGRQPYDWAVRFEKRVRDLLLNGDDSRLVAYEDLGRDAMLSVPTPEHYLPLLYILGLRRKDDPVSFPVQGIDGGSISMLAVRVG